MKMLLLVQPGTRWSYSIGVDVPGYLVEKFSGGSFGDFLRTSIFEPLGMKDTGFYLPKEKLSRLAQVHTGVGPMLAAIDPNRGDPTMMPLGARNQPSTLSRVKSPSSASLARTGMVPVGPISNTNNFGARYLPILVR